MRVTLEGGGDAPLHALESSVQSGSSVRVYTSIETANGDKEDDGYGDSQRNSNSSNSDADVDDNDNGDKDSSQRSFSNSSSNSNRDGDEDITPNINQKQTNRRQAFIVTAHQSDDQLETSLLKLLRGAHISRLYPMLKCSGPFLKPLLDVSKEDLVKYMNDRELEWYEDSSNTKSIYKRNAVRLDLIPLMAELAGGNSALKRRFQSLGEQSLDIREMLQEKTDEFIANDVDFFSSPSSSSFSVSCGSAFHNMSTIAQCEVLNSLIAKLSGLSIDYEHIKRLQRIAVEELGQGKAKRVLDIKRGWILTRRGTTCIISQKEGMI